MQDELEIMRVLRVPPMGKLVVAAEGRRLGTVEEAKDGAQKGRLLAAIGELIAFAGGYEALVGAGVAPALEPVAQDGDGGEPLSPEQVAFLESLERELLETVQSAMPPHIVPELADDVDPLEQKAESLAEAINAILQRHVAEIPALEGRSVHVAQPPGGVLQIEVDGENFERPADIEDEDVRSALRRALQEWEAR